MKHPITGKEVNHPKFDNYEDFKNYHESRVGETYFDYGAAFGCLGLVIVGLLLLAILLS